MRPCAPSLPVRRPFPPRPRLLLAPHRLLAPAVVLGQPFNHDVRQLSTNLLERVADARRATDAAGALPGDMLDNLASRIEAHLASAKVYGLQARAPSGRHAGTRRPRPSRATPLRARGSRG